MSKKEAKAAPKNKGGQPTKYTKELADFICEKVATHSCGLMKLCKMYPEMPHHDSIFLWRYVHPEFSEQYAKAKLKQADLLAEEIIDISDDSAHDTTTTEDGKVVPNTELVARSRLRVDTRKWLASKLLPKQYGDKMILEQKTEENENLKREIKELRERLDEKNKKDY